MGQDLRKKIPAVLPLQGTSALAHEDRFASLQHVLLETPAQPSLPYQNLYCLRQHALLEQFCVSPGFK